MKFFWNLKADIRQKLRTNKPPVLTVDSLDTVELALQAVIQADGDGLLGDVDGPVGAGVALVGSVIAQSAQQHLHESIAGQGVGGLEGAVSITGDDTNILVRFDVPNKRIDLVSLPRDTLLHNEYRNNKLNFAYAKGGTELLMEQIENLLGVPVDFYVTVNLKGFIALVDQIDGVDFDIPINMDYDDPYQDLHIHFTKGPRHLNGQEAMEVVRFRHNNDGTGYGTEDIGRIGTQQAFLKAVAKQLLQIGNVKNIPALVDIFYTYVKTDLTTGNLVWLGNEALNIGTENIHFATLPGDGSGYYNKQSVYVLDAQATCDLVNEALNPYNEALTLEDMDILVP